MSSYKLISLVDVAELSIVADDNLCDTPLLLLYKHQNREKKKNTKRDS